jgi:hypothetical protein
MNTVLVLLAFWSPGLVFGAAIRLRGWTLAAAAPALTFGIVALGVVVFGRFGIAWNLLTVSLWALALSLVMAVVSIPLALRRAAGRAAKGADAEEDGSGATEDPRKPRAEGERRSLVDHLLIGAGVLVGMAVGAFTYLRGIGVLDRINQDWDAPFHGNLVRWIAEHGNASPSSVGAIANLPGKTDYFYPDTYHALLALILDKAGLAMPQLLNLAALAVVLALPLGVAALTAAWRMPTLAVAAAAAVSTWFTAFPYDPLWRGPLWPYVAGIALVPALLAMARHLVVPRGPAGPVGIAVGMAGLAGLHTSLIFVVAVYFLLLLLAVVFRLEPIEWRVAWPSLLGTIVLGAALALPMLLPSLANASGVTGAMWPSEASVAGGLGETITFSPRAPFPQWWLGIPALVGIYLLVKHRRMLWMVGAYGVFGALYAATVSMETPLIHTLTGPFYNDHWRIGALLPLAGAVGFGEFAWTAGTKVAEWVGRWRPSWRPAVVATAGTVLVGLVLALLGNGAYVGRNSTRLANQFHEGPTVTRNEEAAYAWLGQRVAPGERVMNDQDDGSVWLYALEGVQPMEWTFYGQDATTDPGILTGHLNQLDMDPRIRQIVAEYRIRYVVLGEGFVRSNYHRVPGLTGLADNPLFREVYRNPGAVVYEIAGRHDVAAGAGTGGVTGSPGRR